MIEITVGERKQDILKKILRIANQNRVKIIYPTDGSSVSFAEIMNDVYRVLDNEDLFDISLKNFPFCVVADNARDHIIEIKKNGEKLPECQKCLFNSRCGGFPEGYLTKFGQQELRPVIDVPKELMIEIESRCNLSCRFCFNKNSFAQNGRKIKNLSKKQVEEVIEKADNFGIKIIRFTGGEPLLRADIFELLSFSKNKGLETRLNTNGSLINLEIINKLNGLVDNILIPLESSNPNSEAEITGNKSVLEKKIKAVKLIRKRLNNVFLRIGTVAGKESIKNFDKLANLVANLNIDEWEWYRPISLFGQKKPISKNGLQMLVNKIYQARKNYWGSRLFIANAVPFCALKNSEIINAVSVGGLFDDGHSRLVLDPRGFFKPHYFLEKNIGFIPDISGAWNHQFMKKMRNLQYLPEMCHNCLYRFKCCGGSRYEAKKFFGRFSAPDPLSKIK